LQRLVERGVDVTRVKRVRGGPSTGVTVLLHHGGKRHILTYPGTMFEMDANDIDLDYLASARHFHLSSLFLHKALQPALPGIFRKLKAAGLTLSLDTNDDPDDRWDSGLEELLGLVNIFLPNEDEACRITGKADAETAIGVLAARVPIVAIKCGKQGALVQAGQERWRLPAESVAPVDTIGAGDSFNAGFLCAYLKGKPPDECAAFGNRTAALSTLRSGARNLSAISSCSASFFRTPNKQVGRTPLGLQTKAFTRRARYAGVEGVIKSSRARAAFSR